MFCAPERYAIPGEETNLERRGPHLSLRGCKLTSGRMVIAMCEDYQGRIMIVLQCPQLILEYRRILCLNKQLLAGCT